MSLSAAARPASLSGFGSGALKMTVGGRSSVSYTHLRAHETVLDFVCRLLLEKKKIHQLSHHLFVKYTKYFTLLVLQIIFYNKYTIII